MGTEESAAAIVPGREGRNFLVREDRPDGSVGVEPRDGPALSLFGERAGNPVGAREVLATRLLTWAGWPRLEGGPGI